MQTLILVFLAGGTGTLARYGLVALVRSLGATDIPYATVAVNALGCLLFGVMTGWAQRGILPKEVVPVVLVGFLGAFTTFSTFAAEGEQLARGGNWTSFLIYLGLQNVLGILFVAAGLRLVR